MSSSANYEILIPPIVANRIRDRIPGNLADTLEVVFRKISENPETAGRVPPSPPFHPIGRLYEHSIDSDTGRIFVRVFYEIDVIRRQVAVLDVTVQFI